MDENVELSPCLRTGAVPGRKQGFPDDEEESQLPRKLGVKENGNYTVERQNRPRRETENSSRSRPKKFYLNTDGIERRRVAHVRKFF